MPLEYETATHYWLREKRFFFCTDNDKAYFVLFLAYKKSS